MRFMGLILGALTPFTPMILLIVEKFISLPVGVTAEQWVEVMSSYMQPIVLSIAAFIYIYGAIKAMWKAAKDSDVVGRFMVK